MYSINAYLGPIGKSATVFRSGGWSLLGAVAGRAPDSVMFALCLALGVGDLGRPSAGPVGVGVDAGMSGPGRIN